MVDPSCTEPCNASATVNIGIPSRVWFSIYSCICRMCRWQFSPVSGKPSTNPQHKSPTNSCNLLLLSSCSSKIFQECMWRIWAIFSSNVIRCRRSAVRSSGESEGFLYGCACRDGITIPQSNNASVNKWYKKVGFIVCCSIWQRHAYNLVFCSTPLG